MTERANRSFALLVVGSLLGMACGSDSTAVGGAGTAPAGVMTTTTPMATPPVAMAPKPQQTPPVAMNTPPVATPATPPVTTPPATPPVAPPVAMTGTGGMGGPALAGADATAMPAPVADCKKGEVKGSEVLIIGESFYALNSYPKMSLEKLARDGGALDAMEQYRQTAVSATTLGSGQIPSQFDRGIASGPVKLVIMDGGGNDSMGGARCMNCPMVFKDLLAKMGSMGVENVIFTRYPEPGVPPNINQTLASGLNWLMPMMEPICAESTKPVCHWVDLRPVWKMGDCADGLHPTMSGGLHVAEAIWAKMTEKCLAQ